MMRLRAWVLLAGPLPIVAASMAASRWFREDGRVQAAANEVEAVGSPEGTAGRVGHRQRVAPCDAALAAPCERLAAAWRKRLGTECAAIARAPFVLAGDLAAGELDGWHRQTIEPAARAIAGRYCRIPPDRPITVLLFSGEASYNDYARRLFGDEGVSVYGYFKPRELVLVMNIGTGGGTLVHELTHALVAFDFPRIPDWLNEGLASLHEQCRFCEDQRGPWIEGLANWRLPALQETIRRGRLRSLADMIAADDFRGRLEGTNYAQARYFCQYLQRRGLLERLYAACRDNCRDDPLGLAAVAGLFPEQSWAEVERDYREWVLALERP